MLFGVLEKGETVQSSMCILRFFYDWLRFLWDQWRFLEGSAAGSDDDTRSWLCLLGLRARMYVIRLLTTISENPNQSLYINEQVELRVKVLEYWTCFYRATSVRHDWLISKPEGVSNELIECCASSLNLTGS